jgi:hypothetical protein
MAEAKRTAAQLEEDQLRRAGRYLKTRGPAATLAPATLAGAISLDE